MSTTLELLIAVALVAANGFFVASEFASVKMRPTRLVELAGRGHRRARTALDITRHLDAYLSANQLCITLASLALGWIGEEAFRPPARADHRARGGRPSDRGRAELRHHHVPSHRRRRTGALVRDKRGGFDADGRVTLDVLARDAGFQLGADQNDLETLGGHIMARLGRVPGVGDRVDSGGFRLTVAAMRERRVTRVHGERVG
jgi:CBS domain containing-hemolysin-like protein